MSESYPSRMFNDIQGEVFNPLVGLMKCLFINFLIAKISIGMFSLILWSQSDMDFLGNEHDTNIVECITCVLGKSSLICK